MYKNYLRTKNELINNTNPVLIDDLQHWYHCICQMHLQHLFCLRIQQRQTFQNIKMTKLKL